MSWQSPIKTARICFYKSGRQLEHFMLSEDDRAARKLASFLVESDGVILSLENFTEAETRLLKEARRDGGMPLFATDCYGRDKAIHGEKCARLCAYNATLSESLSD